jgi:hypothetical protein
VLATHQLCRSDEGEQEEQQRTRNSGAKQSALIRTAASKGVQP